MVKGDWLERKKRMLEDLDNDFESAEIEWWRNFYKEKGWKWSEKEMLKELEGFCRKVNPNLKKKKRRN